MGQDFLDIKVLCIVYQIQYHTDKSGGDVVFNPTELLLSIDTGSARIWYEKVREKIQLGVGGLISPSLTLVLTWLNKSFSYKHFVPPYWVLSTETSLDYE